MSEKLLIPYYRVNAFTTEPFTGNPAIVCYLQSDIEDELMQKIAFEMNVSETAFIIKNNNEIMLRWFTPKVEVPLCGHGTIAAAYVLFNKYSLSKDVIKSNTKSGILTAQKTEQGIKLEFPLDNYTEYQLPNQVLLALGLNSYVKSVIGNKTKKLVIEVKNSELIKQLKPNFNELINLNFDPAIKGLGVTSKDNDYDFISRYFNPWAGVNEDPVTGSVHTVLAKYYADKLNKQTLTAYQNSPRGGELKLGIVNKGTVSITGKSIIISEGILSL